MGMSNREFFEPALEQAEIQETIHYAVERHYRLVEAQTPALDPYEFMLERDRYMIGTPADTETWAFMRRQARRQALGVEINLWMTIVYAGGPGLALAIVRILNLF